MPRVRKQLTKSRRQPPTNLINAHIADTHQPRLIRGRTCVWRLREFIARMAHSSVIATRQSPPHLSHILSMSLFFPFSLVLLRNFVGLSFLFFFELDMLHAHGMDTGMLRALRIANRGTNSPIAQNNERPSKTYPFRGLPLGCLKIRTRTYTNIQATVDLPCLLIAPHFELTPCLEHPQPTSFECEPCS